MGSGGFRNDFKDCEKIRLANWIGWINRALSGNQNTSFCKYMFSMNEPIP